MAVVPTLVSLAVPFVFRIPCRAFELCEAAGVLSFFFFWIISLQRPILMPSLSVEFVCLREGSLLCLGVLVVLSKELLLIVTGDMISRHVRWVGMKWLRLQFLFVKLDGLSNIPSSLSLFVRSLFARA